MLLDTISPCLAKSMHLGMISGLLVIFFPPLFILHFIFMNFFVGGAVKTKLWLEGTAVIKPPKPNQAGRQLPFPLGSCSTNLSFQSLKKKKKKAENHSAGSQTPSPFTLGRWETNRPQGCSSHTAKKLPKKTGHEAK